MLVTASELNRYTFMNGWHWYSAQMTIPDEGWKIHFSGDAGNAALIYRKLLPTLRRHNLAHKFLPALAAVQGQVGGQLGKILCVYPQNLAEAFQAVGWMDQAYNQHEIVIGSGAPAQAIPASPVIPIDIHVGNTCCYTRYGGFNNDYVMDQNGALQAFPPANGAFPAWIHNPWGAYPALPALPVPWPAHPRDARRRGPVRRGG
jgi:hypothetical protein